MYIDDTKLTKFLETAVPKLVDPTAFKIVVQYCPHCHGPIKFPLIARQCDIDAFQEMLQIAYDYLSENNVPERILSELLDRIDNRNEPI